MKNERSQIYGQPSSAHLKKQYKVVGAVQPSRACDQTREIIPPAAMSAAHCLAPRQLQDGY